MFVDEVGFGHSELYSKKVGWEEVYSGVGQTTRAVFSL